ncbi:hypothetical protein C0J45_20320 [Silurus meridionalis]|nr:hypothetical protein C0J45_20320 [Silurus meridionalis]
MILKEEYSKSVVEVKRVSDRVMHEKLDFEGVMMNVISAYAPQKGREIEEKEKFWSELDEVVEGVPRNERLVIGADLNGHVGEGNRGDEEVMVVMDRLTDEVRQESPWTMMFADDIVICGESSEQVEKSLERWRYALERRGMKVSRSKTEYMCVNERECSGVVQLQEEEEEKVEEFRYLGSTVQINGECVGEVKKRVQAGWKTVALSKRQEVELEVAELKMLWFSLGVTTINRIRNEFLRGTAHVGHSGDKVREVRLRWFGHVQRRDMGYISRRMLRMEPPGRRKRGRPRRRFMDVVREDMQVVGLKEADVEDRGASTLEVVK